jgi:hypothetical protein
MRSEKILSVFDSLTSPEKVVKFSPLRGGSFAAAQGAVKFDDGFQNSVSASR